MQDPLLLPGQRQPSPGRRPEAELELGAAGTGPQACKTVAARLSRCWRAAGRCCCRSDACGRVRPAPFDASPRHYAPRLLQTLPQRSRPALFASCARRASGLVRKQLGHSTAGSGCGARREVRRMASRTGGFATPQRSQDRRVKCSGCSGTSPQVQPTGGAPLPVAEVSATAPYSLRRL